VFLNQLTIIALDGPSGVGKSTTAKQVAARLGWDYLDTGAMYRATALALLSAQVDLQDPVAVERELAALRIDQRGTRTFLRDEDVSDMIRTPEITRLVTPVSANARIREVLVEQQRAIGRRGGWVVDGRDIGTVVFPNACCKIFLTASTEARGRRRFLEQQSKGIGATMTLQEVMADIERRDHADSTRAASPLRQAEDAVVLDSSAMTLEQVVTWIVDHHRSHN
jgi:cytidylate kinase